MSKYTIERGTDWVSQFAFHSGQNYVEDWRPGRYVSEKLGQVVSDAESLKDYMESFVETGDLVHLADYRGLLRVMLNEIDNGAWYAIVNDGAR